MIHQITALRALAIILIFLFHLAPGLFPCGYFGVEVFLVISGYLLMYSLQKQQGEFRLGEFARKKLIRLFIPITAIILLTLLAAIPFLDSEDLSYACKTATNTLKGTANKYLARTQANYFAPDASYNPFLHMWYVSVICHVYLLFAAVCMLKRFIPQRAMVLMLWVAGIASFLWAYSYPIHNVLQAMGLPVWEQVAPVSHYMTLPRLWEPLAGIWLATRQAPRAQSTPRAMAGVVAGLACILIPSLLHGVDASALPLLVVVGTCLVIRSGGHAGALSALLNNRLLLSIGTISFSLYLVHMPLIALWHIVFLRGPQLPGMLILSIATLVLGYLFYRWVEKRPAGWKALLILYVLATAMCIVCRKTNGFRSADETEGFEKVPGAEACTLAHVHEGFNPELFPYFSWVEHYTVRSNPQQPPASTILHLGATDAPPTVVLFGDSHAAAAYPGVDAVLREMGVSGVYISSLVFPFWDRETPNSFAGYPCGRQKIEAFMHWLRQHPEIRHLVINTRWKGWIEITKGIDWDKKTFTITDEDSTRRLRRFILEMNAMGKNVILLGPTPYIEQTNPPRVTRSARRWGFELSDEHRQSLSCTREQYHKDAARAISMIHSLEAEGICHVLHVHDYIPAGQPFYAYEDGQVLYEDSNHLSPPGAIKLFRYLRPQLERALQAPPATK